MTLPKGKTESINISNVNKNPFIMFQAHQDDFKNISKKFIKNKYDKSIISHIFFNKKNIQIIHQQIIQNIFKISKGKYLIEKQNEDDVLIVMKNIFSKYQYHETKNIKNQIKKLNNLVIEEVTPYIISEINYYYGYLDMILGEKQMLDRPKNVSKAGTKILPSII